MSSMFNTSKVLCALKREKIGQHVCVGMLLVLASAAMSLEMLEITAGLVGAVVVVVMRGRASVRRACVSKLDTTLCLKSEAVGPDSVSVHKMAKFSKTPVCNFPAVDSSSEPIHKFVPRLHQAEPRAEFTLADGLPMCEQVDQLLRDALPGKVDTSVCEEFARLVSPCIRKLIPEAQIDVVAHSSVVRIGRTGLRPEVDLLVTVPPNILAQRLLTHIRENAGDRSVRKLHNIMEVEENTLNKFAIRAVSSQLTFCKLWRTAFRGVEPKLVLLAPRCLGVLSEDMHVHVYVNCPSVIRSREVFNHSDSHVQKLIAFVRRWAQDRCIANNAYGHMPLYAWTLSVMYFCQSQVENCSKHSTIELFGLFIDFHIKRYKSFGQAQDGVALQIEDPYDPQRNVAACMSATGMERFGEELERAKAFLANRSSLLDLFEHCNPSFA